MYEYLIGYITEINDHDVTLEVNHVGYDLHIANPSSYHVDPKKLVKVFVYQVVTDSYQLLYGFPTRIDKILFTKLINVSGIGPKNAIGILSGNDNGALLNAINEENVTYLTKFPGVGKKTAKQIILDLHDKLKALMPAVGAPKKQPQIDASQHLIEALQALEALGYRRSDVNDLKAPLSKLPKLSTNAYISRGLKLLNRLS